MNAARKDLDGPPERAVERMVKRQKNHKIWDFLFLFAPPILAVLYLSVVVFHRGYRGGAAFCVGIAGVVASLGLFFFQRRSRLSARQAARLIDGKVAAEDRFVTLSTARPGVSPVFFDRLRVEAQGFLKRLDLKRDFPYRVKPSFAGSFAVCVILIVLFHWFFESSFTTMPAASPVKELSALARELSQEPRFAALAKRVEELVRKMEQRDLSTQEKNQLVREILRELEAQQRNQQKRQDRSGSDLLNRTDEALEGLEKGQEKRDEGKGGGLKTNLPDESEGKGKEKSKGGGGEDESNQKGAQETQALEDGQPTRLEPKDQNKGQEEGKGKGESMTKKGETRKETEGTAQQEMEGKGKVKETDIPQGRPPEERFYKAGEGGEKGIKGAGYVTVELPEAGSSRPGSGTGEEKGPSKKSKIPVPVSNVPLSAAAAPGRPQEKQPLPVEYENLIR